MSKLTGSFCCWLVMLTALIVVSGCSHKPAYSDIDTQKKPENHNQAGNSNNAQASAPTDAQTPGPAATPANANAQTPPAQPTTIKIPTFLDQATGAVKDLPSYPHAQRVSIQYGPMQGINTLSLALKTGDKMDQITAFYERVIKENKWKVVDKLIDPEFSEWTLKKTDDDTAKIQIKKDQLSAALNIIIVRTEKEAGTSK